ncbi:glycan biosynthesis protein [Colletotrichum truncatum]|uniref:Glycan biosynthesis protein n=1 Tax=Colletotrichum truncatum TaxID=5467 RepID=A0ACC3YKV9_COLTU
MLTKSTPRGFLKAYYFVRVLRIRRRILIRFAVLALLVPIFLQYALAYHLGSDARLLPRELQDIKNILIVTAHPDDECLFFAPIIVGVLDKNDGIKGGLLALSTGNNKGLGDTRKKELRGSCEALGIDSSRCEALDHPDLQDNPTAWWDTTITQAIIKEYVHKWDIDTIITFDEYGISGHINHRAVSAAVSEYVKSDSSAPVAYKLVTTTLLRKYTFLFDLPFTALAFAWRIAAAVILPSSKINEGYSRKALVVSTWQQYFKTRNAFASHNSQYSWDRHLYMILSRYVWFNDIKRMPSDRVGIH